MRFPAQNRFHERRPSVVRWVNARAKRPPRKTRLGKDLYVGTGHGFDDSAAICGLTFQQASLVSEGVFSEPSRATTFCFKRRKWLFGGAARGHESPAGTYESGSRQHH
jgi:hypothetical protein